MNLIHEDPRIKDIQQYLYKYLNKNKSVSLIEIINRYCNDVEYLLNLIKSKDNTNDDK